MNNYVTEPTDCYVSKYDLEGSEEQVIERIRGEFQCARAQYTGEVTFFLDWKPRDYEAGEELYIYVRRPETREQQVLREANAKAQKQHTEDCERRLLAELQAKYKTS